MRTGYFRRYGYLFSLTGVPGRNQLSFSDPDLG